MFLLIDLRIGLSVCTNELLLKTSCICRSIAERYKSFAYHPLQGSGEGKMPTIRYTMQGFTYIFYSAALVLNRSYDIAK